MLTVGFGFNRFPNDTQDISKGFNQATLGFPSNYLAALSKTGFPAITTDSGLTNEGTSNSGPAVYFSRNFVVGVAKSLGKHSVKVGYVYRAISLSYTSLSNTDGTFAFDNTLSAYGFNAAGNRAALAGQGATAASMLLGYATSGSLVIPAPLAITTDYQAAYMQDDFPPHPQSSRSTSDSVTSMSQACMSATITTPSASTAPQPTTPSTPALRPKAVSSSRGRMAIRPRPATWAASTLHVQASRMSWTTSTVVKGGAGLFYMPLVYSNSAALAPGYVLTNSFSQSSPTISLSNPFPTLKTVASGNSNGLSQNIGTTLSVIDQGRRAPLYQSYSLDLRA